MLCCYLGEVDVVEEQIENVPLPPVVAVAADAICRRSNRGTPAPAWRSVGLGLGGGGALGPVLGENIQDDPQ